MSVDLTWTFYKAKLNLALHRRTVALYCCLGFGLPLFLTVVAGICQVAIVNYNYVGAIFIINFCSPLLIQSQVLIQVLGK